mmetsp:Transcript_32978/g.107827  ORF Transcript_32978/g.107827 Transcript_32978/m.107827 type:complete len:230 (-) Transcript_32978:41-730(-)
MPRVRHRHPVRGGAARRAGARARPRRRDRRKLHDPRHKRPLPRGDGGHARPRVQRARRRPAAARCPPRAAAPPLPAGDAARRQLEASQGPRVPMSRAPVARPRRCALARNDLDSSPRACTAVALARHPSICVSRAARRLHPFRRFRFVVCVYQYLPRPGVGCCSQRCRCSEEAALRKHGREGFYSGVLHAQGSSFSVTAGRGVPESSSLRCRVANRTVIAYTHAHAANR